MRHILLLSPSCRWDPKVGYRQQLGRFLGWQKGGSLPQGEVIWGSWSWVSGQGGPKKQILNLQIIMVLSSYIREGEYGFSSPEGCVEGLPETHPEGEENPYSHNLIYEERHSYRRYRILSYFPCSTTVIIILSLSERERMKIKVVILSK